MLFKDITKIKQYAELTTNTSFDSVKDDIRFVEEQHIIPLLGKTLYDALNTEYTSASNETDLSDANKALLHRCRTVIGPFLIYYRTPKNEVKMSDAGLQRIETANNKSAFQYQVKRYQQAFINQATIEQDMLLGFLEEKITDYPDWTASNEFKQYRSSFVNSSRTFAALYATATTPHLLYHKLRSKMVEAEEIAVRKAIGNNLFDALKTKATSANPAYTEKEKQLILCISNAVIYLALAAAVPFLTVRIDGNGISVINGSAADDDELKRSAATDSQLSLLIREANDTGNYWLESAASYIRSYPADFPDYNNDNSLTVKSIEANSDLKHVFGLY